MYAKAYLSAESEEEEASAWFPEPFEYARGQKCPSEAPGKGQEVALGLNFIFDMQVTRAKAMRGVRYGSLR